MAMRTDARWLHRQLPGRGSGRPPLGAPLRVRPRMRPAPGYRPMTRTWHTPSTCWAPGTFPCAAWMAGRASFAQPPGNRRCFRLLPPAEGDVSDPAGAGHGLNPEAVFERLQPIPEPLPAAQHDGHHDDVQVVDQAGGQELADSGRAAADADVRASGGLARLRKRLGGAGVEEVKRGTAFHPDGGPQMVGEDKDRGVERRGVSPPSVPLLVRPRAVVRAELAPAHDLGADARSPSAGESVVDTGAAAG